MRVEGLGFTVYGVGFRVWGRGFTIWGLVCGVGFRVIPASTEPSGTNPRVKELKATPCRGSGFRVGVQGAGLGFRVQGSGSKVQGSGFMVQSAGFRVQGSGSRVQGAECKLRTCTPTAPGGVRVVGRESEAMRESSHEDGEVDPTPRADSETGRPGCRVQGAGFRVQGPGFRVQGSGSRFGVQGSG